jgi:hypothetical protein
MVPSWPPVVVGVVVLAVLLLSIAFAFLQFQTMKPQLHRFFGFAI